MLLAQVLPRRATRWKDDMAQRASNLYDIPPKHLRNGSRRSRLVEARSLFCFWAVRYGGFPAARVAAFLSMTPPAVGYAVERGDVVARDKGYAL